MREPSDLKVRYVVYFGAGLALGIVLVFVLMTWIFNTFSDIQKKEASAGTTPESSTPPEPRLQISPEADNRQFIAREREVLTRYGWIDKEKGVARVPIDRAMEIMLERGVK
jgi:hypothetical protein